MQEVAHRTVPARLRPWLALVGVAAACAAILFGGDRTAQALRYDRNALLDGELWRALSGHFVHTSWAHLGAGIAVAALVVAAYGRDLRPAAVVCIALGTSAGLFLLALRVRSHVGLSGLLGGLVAFGALEGWRRGRRRAWLPVAPLLGLVIAAEAWTLEPFETLHDAASVRWACVFGAVSGVLAFAILYRPSRVRR